MARKTVQRNLLLLMAGTLAFGLCACTPSQVKPPLAWVAGQAARIANGQDEIVFCMSGPPPEYIWDPDGKNCRETTGNEKDDLESNASSEIPLEVKLGFAKLRPPPNERRAASSGLSASSPRSRKVLLVGRGKLKLLDMGTNAVTATVALRGRFGSQVAVSSDGALAAVGVRRFQCAAPDGVDIIDVPTMTRIGTVDLAVESVPTGISFRWVSG